MAAPQITLQGFILGIFGEPNPAKIIVMLCGFGAQAPRVVGTAMLAPTAPVEVECGADGSYSFQLYGNDQITPAGTYYTVLISDSDGNMVQLNAYQFAGTHTYDLSNLNPYMPVPSPPVPSGAVLLNPAGGLGSTQVINSNITIVGNLQVDGTTTFNFGMYAVPINGGNPFFDGSKGYGQQLTLTEDVTASTAGNFSLGIALPFVIVQDGDGGRAFAWPASFKNPPEINSAPNGVTSMTWMLALDGNYYAGGSAVWS